jgi:DNA-binding MarR family transcriptional regulator
MTTSPPPQDASGDTAAPVVTALNKLALALRTGAWDAAAATGLHPTQAQVLAVLASRATGLRVGRLAEELGVTQPTVSDSVAALVAKQLVERGADPTDRRATIVRLTETGRRHATELATWPDAMLAATDDLDEDEAATLLRLLVKMIRALQERGAIPVARMCVTCRYFSPFRHPATDQPHHCNLVDSAFGDSRLRVDCAEHEPADPVSQAETWVTFTGSTPPDLR